MCFPGLCDATMHFIRGVKTRVGFHDDLDVSFPSELVCDCFASLVPVAIT
jgi:hypothetical protein